VRRLLGAVGVFLIAMAPPALSQIDFLYPDGIASGDVTPTTAVLWTRRQSEIPVTVEVAADRTFSFPVFTATTTPAAERGGVVKFTASGLTPATRYFYRFTLDGTLASETGTFTTAPAEEAAADLRLAFSGDADGTHVGGRPVHSFVLLDAVTGDRPELFVFLGDTVYADSPLAPRPASTLEQYRAKYRESRSIPGLQRLLRTIPVVAIWDDHEVQNDFDRETVSPARFAVAHRAFVEAWPVGEQPDGRLYRSFRWGREVELFILDLRSYRSRQASKTRACDNPPEDRVPDLAPTLSPALRARFALLIGQFGRPVPPACLTALADSGRTLLGPAQKLWLKEGLRGSEATWKFVFSQVPMQEFFALPYDRWEGYAAERAEILDFIRANKIANVVWLSADTHAVLINDVRFSTFAPSAETGMKEVVVGPIATTPFGAEVAEAVGPLVPAAFAAFLLAAPPRGLGAECVVLDRFTYALVEVRSQTRTVTITPKDAAGRPVCRAPLMLRAAP